MEFTATTKIQSITWRLFIKLALLNTIFKNKRQQNAQQTKM